jgi:predicted RNA-binding Zn-ribbon protein involved in translation (DUF1610 family)
MQVLVANAATFGLTPFLMPGKKIIMTFVCPKCKGHEMIKFIKQPDLRNKIHACKDCGYRFMSPGWVKRHGTFLTGITV